jgi:hypothetical protein
MAECFHGHILAKGQLGRELLGALPERLPFLRAINAIEPDLFDSPIVQNCNRVTVRDADDAAGDVASKYQFGDKKDEDSRMKKEILFHCACSLFLRTEKEVSFVYV